MQIPQNLPQFEENKTLIIVASTQSANLYVANNGDIELATEVRTEKIDHDDQEGHFERRSHGKQLGSASAETDESQKIKKRFHGNLKEALESLNIEEMTQTILLSSPQDKADTKKQLPHRLAVTLALEINGNFVGEHPKKILEKINESE